MDIQRRLSSGLDAELFQPPRTALHPPAQLNIGLRAYSRRTDPLCPDRETLRSGVFERASQTRQTFERHRRREFGRPDITSPIRCYAAGVTSSSAQGQLDHEGCAFPSSLAVCTDSSGVHFDDGFADRETEPQTFAPRIGLFEGSKDFSDKFWFDADAAIADLDGDSSWVRIYDRTESAPFSGVNLQALRKTFQKTCSKRGGSATSS